MEGSKCAHMDMANTGIWHCTANSTFRDSTHGLYISLSFFIAPHHMCIFSIYIFFLFFIYFSPIVSILLLIVSYTLTNHYHHDESMIITSTIF